MGLKVRFFFRVLLQRLPRQPITVFSPLPTPYINADQSPLVVSSHITWPSFLKRSALLLLPSKLFLTVFSTYGT
jgi:hypothetical protein